jgi:Protein of unknown function (DUF1553)/Protein of unknown function (DUF1549)
MSRFRTLLVVMAALVGLGTVLADDAKKPDAKTVKQARQEARRKAAAEEAAKAKAEADAKAKAKADAEAAAKAKADAEAKKKSEQAKSTPKLDYHPLTKTVDSEITKRLIAEKIPASPRADDAEFIRRVYLDLTGVIPPAHKAAEFIDSKDADKRAKLVDELLDGPAFAKHQADIWDNLLFQRTTDNRAVKMEPLTTWLEEKFTTGATWDKIVSEILTATGTQEENGASTYFLSTLSADKMVDSTSKLFMGIKMECTQCHNHPFTGWKQNEYWGMAQFFMKVRVQGNTKNAKNGATPGVTESGQGRQRNLPESAKAVPAKFFKGEEPKVSRNEPMRPVLAKWLTSADNKYFSRAWANRVWGQLFGLGIVNPIDDMHDERVPSHPELLQELSRQFAASGFDVRFLYRAICNSDTYQRTSKPAAGNEKDTTLFSHMNIKAFTPEQLYDSLTAILGDPGREARNRANTAANAKRGPVGPRDQFVAFFETSDNSKATEYDAGIPQALRLMNNPFTARNSTRAANEIARGASKEQAIEKLYLSTLARRPTSDEMKKLTDYVAKNSDGLGDILWALLNSSEFTLNH